MQDETEGVELPTTEALIDEPEPDKDRKPRRRRGLKFTGERQVGRSLDEIDPRHIERYEFAAGVLFEDFGEDGRLREVGDLPLMPGARVIDVACGVGYGSHILSDHGFDVVGVDVSPEAIDFAQSTWANERTSFVCADVEGEEFPDLGEFDVAVSIETMEHLNDPSIMIERLVRMGVRWIVASVPNEKVVVFVPSFHEFHKRHYEPQQFENALKPFKVVDRAYQNRSSIFRRGWHFSDARTLIAVGTARV